MAEELTPSSTRRSSDGVVHGSSSTTTRSSSTPTRGSCRGTGSSKECCRLARQEPKARRGVHGRHFSNITFALQRAQKLYTMADHFFQRKSSISLSGAIQLWKPQRARRAASKRCSLEEALKDQLSAATPNADSSTSMSESSELSDEGADG